MKKIIFCLSAMLCFGSIALAYGGNNWGLIIFLHQLLTAGLLSAIKQRSNIAELNSESWRVLGFIRLGQQVQLP